MLAGFGRVPEIKNSDSPGSVYLLLTVCYPLDNSQMQIHRGNPAESGDDVAAFEL